GAHQCERLVAGDLEDVEVGEDVGDLQVGHAGLPLAEHRALAPDLQIDGGEVEPVVGADHRRQPLLAFLGGGVGYEDAGAGMPPAAHRTPQLVELGQPEAVGVFDHHDGGVGDVDAHFDDGGGDERVDLA